MGEHVGCERAWASMTDQDSTTAPDITFEIAGAGGLPLTAYAWLPAGTPRAVVLIVHGMGEHALRYGRFARALNGAGYAAYGFDLRGHGATGVRQGLLGHFADEAGWRLLVADIAIAKDAVSARHAGLPVLLFAHSMGSLLGQDFVIHHGHSLGAVVFSGTDGGNGPALLAGEGVALLERRRLGGRAHSALLERLAMGDTCKAFRPCRTEYDWLSRDEAEVDKYVADPLCGFSLTVQGWLDLFRGLKGVEPRYQQGCIRKSLPIFLIGGALDPVGKAGKGASWLQGRYRAVGMQDVELKLYPDARHEMLNETNREEVHLDVLAFYDRVV